MLSMLAYPYGSPFYLSPFLLRCSIFSFLPLAALDWLYTFSGRIPTRRLLLLFFIGIAAAVGSGFYSTMLVAAGPCTPGVSGAGFPLPWFLSFYTPYLGPLCPFPSPDTNVGTFPFFAFLFDVIFYLAFAIAGNELYRWAKGKRLHRTTIALRVPRKTPRKRLRVHGDVNVNWK